MLRIASLIAVLLSLACSQEESNTSPEKAEETIASEPIQVGGAFLVSCGPVENQESEIGCKSLDESISLSELETKAYLLTEDEGEAQALSSETPPDTWDVAFRIPDDSASNAIFRLDILNDEGDATGSYQQPLAELLTR